MIEWGVCARLSLCVFAKERETRLESIVLYSGNNVREKRFQAVKKNPPNQRGKKRVFLASLNTST